MEIIREWAMPSSDTFTIKPINKLLDGIVNKSEFWIDPFVRDSVFKDRMRSTNDLSTEFNADYHIDALEYLRTFGESEVDGVLFDPPYSPRQISECYQGVGRKVTMKDTQSSFWSNIKKELSRIINDSGICVTFGWNSGGIGKCNGFSIEKILLVPHGGWHNDTIVTVERRNIRKGDY